MAIDDHHGATSETPDRWRRPATPPPPPLARAEPLGAGAAAAFLGVDATTLRSWANRFGFPCSVSRVGPPAYPVGQLLALREALQETSSVPAAVRIARRRVTRPRPESLRAVGSSPCD